MSNKVGALRNSDLKRLLEAKGIRTTEQRLRILRELASLRMPVSHSELTRRLARSALDRVTIYRNLLSLSAAGILIRTQLGDRQWRFELPTTASAEHDRHPHFVCNDCGSVSCLPPGAVALSGEAARAEVQAVHLHGRCAQCVDEIAILTK